ncbi:DEAD/DEAH box helicase [Candidatus Uhrbacteria bacterium]|nr:DEAD/DEAH box helicase [Candidatus Uhrbacteria bacterium]
MKDGVQPVQSGFHTLSIAPKLLRIVEGLGFETPTPIQHGAIPPAIEGRDILGIAQTGTGKTLAFAVPLIQRLSVTGRGLIIVPTRELALQVDETFRKLGRTIGLKTVVLIGGGHMDTQLRTLRTYPHVIIGTPGRINDHIERKTLKLDAVSVLVLDEADLMLDMGFMPQINRILETVPKIRQTMLFSATMPPAIGKLAATYMTEPVRVEIARSGSIPEMIEQEVRYVDAKGKTALLDALLKERHGSAIVFVRSKHGAKKLCTDLNHLTYTATEIHSNRTLAQRRFALDGFKAGKKRVLVATDIAARGIDVSSVALIVNYDLPENPEDYIHRIGRTGRAGLKGHAVSFATPAQRHLVYRIERLMQAAIPVTGKVPFNIQERHGDVPPEKRPFRGRAKRTSYSQNYGFRKKFPGSRPGFGPKRFSPSRDHRRRLQK